MHFIAEDPIQVHIRSEKPQIVDANTREVIAPKQRRVYAKFKRGTAPGWLREKALATFEFRKRPGLVDPGAWVAYYDSIEDQVEKGWTDEERQVIEEKLSQHVNCLKAEQERLAPPYGNYDKHRKTVGKRTIEHAIADILAAYESAGFDVHHAIAYEVENENNPQVIAALDGLLATEAPGVEDAVIAA